MTSEFKDTAEFRTAQTALETAHVQFQQASLTASIKAKSDEVAVLDRQVAPEAAWTTLRAIVSAHAPSILERNKLPTMKRDEHNREVVDKWEHSDTAIAVRDHVLADCVVYAARIVSITESSITHRALKIKKKKDLATAARTAAGDVDVDMQTSSASIQSLVDKAVSSALKKFPQSGGHKRKRSQDDGNPAKGKKGVNELMAQAKVRLSHSPSQSSNASLFPDALRSRDRQVARQQTQVRPSSLQTPLIAKLNRRGGQEATTQQGRETRSRQRPARQEAAGKRQGKGKGKAPRSAQVDTWLNVNTDWRVAEGPSTNGASTPYAKAWEPSVSNRSDLDRVMFHRPGMKNPGAFIAPGDLWTSNPRLLPDYLLDLPVPLAINEIVSNMSLEMIRSLSYQQDVHCSPGVHLPKELAYQISVGAKYMFHEPSNVDLIRKAWQDFNRRLRWRINFLFDKGIESPYDPDFDVRPPSNKQAPPLPHYIELGLIKGRGFVNETIRKVPDVQTLRHPHKSLQPDVGSIRDFLLNKEYVITGTDKNLGTAVSKRDWLIEKSQDILNDVNNYRLLEHDEAIRILNEKCSEMESLGNLAFNYVDHLEGSIADFLRSKITLRGETHHIPKFYGIPKIHKQPVKMRPIIPCHSAIQNPAAKYVSKKLKPLIAEAATVIHGTKDLAYKLSKLTIDKTRKWYIVTGDVVAFYPNIPLTHCLDIVYNMYFEHYWNIQNHDDPSNQARQNLFKRCLEVGNTNLLTQFNNKIYLQLNGLAMGVADSPDLANLYGYYFEKLSNVINHPNIFYYGRYIDDCLAIVYAESELQALNILQEYVQFDNCTITWDASDHHQPFLDMMLYKDADNTLQHMPYRKNGNHQERIPWTSAHPYDVKRGTFLGEMSRLATLSSKLDHYLEAMRGLVALYIRRSYPADEVHKWLYSNLAKRWDSRLVEKSTSEGSDVLVLKTQYNIAWNYFNAHQLGDTIFGYWREWLLRADTGEFNNKFPAPEKKDRRTAAWRVSPGLSGQAPPQGLLDDAWDLRKTNLFNSKVILSRKRTRNFLDISNLWKRSVFQSMEESMLDDIVGNAARAFAQEQHPVIPDVNTLVVGPRLKRPREDPSNDEEDTIEHVARRYNSSGPSSWRQGAMTTWGRGSRA